MKKLRLLYITALVFFSGCSDVLDKEPLDSISDAAVWSDPVLIDDYLNQCYADMVFAWESPYGGANRATGPYSWFEQVYSLTFADETRADWNPAPKYHQIGPNGGIYEWWGYPTIRRLNIFLEQLAPMDLDEPYKSNRMAEARYLRAHAYFNMVKRYGGVPLITKAQQLDDSDEELFPSRNKEAEIYDFIISELDAIALNLPGDEEGRPSRWAALALKSRAAMYAASIATWGTVDLDGVVGISSGLADDYWQVCYDTSKEIITNGPFALYKASDDRVANFRNLFLDEGNSEVIFSERFNGLSGKGHSLDMFNVPSSYHVWSRGQQASLYLEMAESFDNIDGSSGIIDRDKIGSGHLWTIDELFGQKDPRFKASVYTQGTSWMNGDAILDYHKGIATDQGIITSGAYKGVLANSIMNKASTPFGVLKYLDEEERAEAHERNHSDTDYIIFRLGEVLLNYAEAAMELGHDGDALSAINQLRERAGMSLYDNISRELIRKERKVELAFEGNRYWDLIRWRIAAEELSQSFHSLRLILDGNSYTEGNFDVLTAKYKLQIINDVNGTPPPVFDQKHYYMPIGLSRTAQNPNLVENPGYIN